MSFKFSLRSLVRHYSSPARKGEVQVSKLLGRPSNNLTSGIVGLANVGKSTFFQAITKSTLGNPANYPFATIEPEEARVLVPSRRLDRLAQLYGSKRKLPAVLKIFDIAGLVRGASDNKGLGNAFLNDIRAVDGIFQVVRAFRDDDITHIEGNVDSTRDLSIVQDELLLKDMEFIENAVERLTKQLRNAKSKQTHEAALLKVELDTLNLAYDLIIEGQRVINKKDWTNEQIDALNVHTLLTAKPAVFLVNVNEEDYLRQTNEFLDDIKAWVDENAPGSPVILFSASYETKLNEEESLDPSDIPLSPESSALPDIIHKMRESLQLISFYTCGPIEARQWTVQSNTLAPQAAGVIHTDFEKTFINAEVIKYDDIKDYQPPFEEKILRSRGKISRVGKNYVVEDGDLITFKAAAAKSRK